MTVYKFNADKGRQHSKSATALEYYFIILIITNSTVILHKDFFFIKFIPMRSFSPNSLFYQKGKYRFKINCKAAF